MASKNKSIVIQNLNNIDIDQIDFKEKIKDSIVKNC